MARVESSTRRAIVLSLLGICIANLSHLQVFSIPERIRQRAQAAGNPPVEFLEDIEQMGCVQWQPSKEVAGRDEFMDTIRKVMTKRGLSIVLGSRNIGKSKIFANITASIDDSFPMLYVNMRLPSKPGSRDIFECLQEAARKKWTREKQGNELALDIFKGVMQAVSSKSAFTTLIAELLNIPKPAEFLEAFVRTANACDQVPVIIVDEANLAFPDPNGNGNGVSSRRMETTETALAAFLAITKEKYKACVILVASEYAFPYRLEKQGQAYSSAVNIILAPEVEQEAMIEVLTERWGMPQDLAKAFYEQFCGDISVCDKALAKLIDDFHVGDEDDFDPYGILDNFGLSGLVKDPLTHRHMKNIAKQGWSPIAEAKAKKATSSQEAARIVAKLNFGAVVGKKAKVFGHLRSIRKEMFKDRNKQVLIPTTQYMQKCIQVEVEGLSWWRRLWLSLRSR